MEEKSVKCKKMPQELVAGISVAAWVCAALMSAYAVVYAIWTLNYGGILGGRFAHDALSIGTVALTLGFIAFFMDKKITDKEIFGKVCGIAKKVLFFGAIMYLAAALATALYALFAIGADGISQQSVWVDMFLPKLGIAAAAIGLKFLIKEICCGTTKIKIMPFVFYAIFAVAGLAILLSIISTFVGLYGNGGGCTGIHCYL
ncbi:hypothetical protein FWC31_02350 [Candidatus Saccharibacteria bacterium]|nr:hypothetical protein [Candidatus Saccharibacteria bacterium]